MSPVARIAALAILFLPLTAKAQPQGPFTSGGNLPYIASGQSEEDIQRKKKARAEAEAAAKARQDAEDKAKQEAAKAAPEAQPVIEPAKVIPPKQDAPAKPAEGDVAVKPDAIKPAKVEKPIVAGDPAQDASKPKITRAKPQDMVPPGVMMDNQPIGSTQMPRPPATVLVRPRETVVVVEKPMFFGLFGPRVPVKERVVELVPPGSINRAPMPPAAVMPPPGGRIAAGQKVRPGSSSCHYHAYPSIEAPYHRDVQCHWHQNPTESSLRYVQ